ncbi:MAG: ribosome maturation factor RimP [Pseudomonadota bacterium]
MSVLRDKVAEIITPELKARGVELVEVELSGNAGKTLIKLYIDNFGSTGDKCTLTISDCEKVSRAVDQLLNVEGLFPRDYTLEVSTPGVERPIRTADEYKRFKGKLAQIISDNVSGSVLVGRIKDADAVSVTLDVDGKEQKIDLNSIKRAKLKLER